MVAATLAVLLFACLWLSMAFPQGNSFTIPVVQQCMKLQTPGKIFHGANMSASAAKHLEVIVRFPMVPQVLIEISFFYKMHISLNVDSEN